MFVPKAYSARLAERSYPTRYERRDGAGPTGDDRPRVCVGPVVISRDYLGCPVDEIKDIEVLTTVVGGRVVYEKPGTTRF